jgi:iron complex transport system substrate-binding protein
VRTRLTKRASPLSDRRARVAINLLIVGAMVLLTGCSPQTIPQETKKRAMRIVSLDYCADQYVLKLADRGDIAALSPDATRAFSYMREEAQGLRQVRPTGEDVLALKPDLIIRTYGGGPEGEAFFKRAGVRVHQIGWGDDFEAVRTNVTAAATAMGQQDRGEHIVAAFDHDLAAITKSPPQSALYLTPSGVTSGPGSMIDAMMGAAGLNNFQTKAGWHPINLEGLIFKQPNIIARVQFGPTSDSLDPWSVVRHPRLQKLVEAVPTAHFDGATTSCTGWFVLDGIKAMAGTGRAAR